jgi:alkylated DNA repair dioxygenase AlkB
MEAKRPRTGDRTGRVATLPWRTLAAGTTDLGEESLIDLHPGALADVSMDDLRREIPFAQEEVTVLGRTYLEPRLTSYHALAADDPRFVYVYSGSRRVPRPMTPHLNEIRRRCLALVEPHAGAEDLNTVLCNLYLTGSHAVGWHTDRDLALYGEEPLIVSVSLGNERLFRIRSRRRPEARHERRLGGGDVLVMRGRTQDRFVHCVTRTTSPVGSRLNLTFRTIHDGRAGVMSR